MAELALDVVEPILLQLDVEDLIRCKSVCKSWHSFISSPRFVKAQLNHPYTNDRHNHELGHRRICFSVGTTEDSFLFSNHMFMVGSCNGLVCLCPRDVDFLVTNPLTRQVKKLPTPPHMHKVAMIRQGVCWGFGYDSCSDDYKVIVGFVESVEKKRTLFYALTLKSNTWKVIGEVRCKSYMGRSGILCGGALHRFMIDKNYEHVIVSLDLSTEQFKEIPTPPSDLLYKCDYLHKLGVIEDCLCIYSYFDPLTSKKWVMKNDKWELYDDHFESKYDVAHHLTTESHVVDDGTRVPCNGKYISASMYVKTLVSPHPHVNNDGQKRSAKQGEEGNERVESSAKGNIRKRKRKKTRKTYCKHKSPLVI